MDPGHGVCKCTCRSEGNLILNSSYLGKKQQQKSIIISDQGYLVGYYGKWDIKLDCK